MERILYAKKAYFADPRSIVELAYVTGWGFEEIINMDLSVFELFHSAAAGLMNDLNKP